MMTKPITVLYGISQLTIGGAERQLYELARHIDRTRYRPLVFTTSEGGVYADLLRDAGIPLYVFLRHHPYDISPVFKIASLMRREQVQILHTFGFYGGLYGRLATFLYRPNIIISSERAVRAWMKHLHNPVYFAADKLLSRRTDCFIANAKAVKQFAVDEKQLPSDKVYVVYNGVDEERFKAVDEQTIQRFRKQYAITQSTPTVGIVARLDPMKDHYTFLHSAAIVHQEIPNTRFFVIGDGPLRTSLEGLSSDLQLNGSVVFTGAKKGADLVNLMALMDVIVLSSKEGEGCSNAILEAMALGKPVVATDVGGNAELVIDQKTGFIVPAMDFGEISRFITQLLQDRTLTMAMGQAGYTIASKKFSISRMLSDTISIYEQFSKES